MATRQHTKQKYRPVKYTGIHQTTAPGTRVHDMTRRNTTRQLLPSVQSVGRWTPVYRASSARLGSRPEPGPAPPPSSASPRPAPPGSSSAPAHGVRSPPLSVSQIASDRRCRVRLLWCVPTPLAPPSPDSTRIVARALPRSPSQDERGGGRRLLPVRPAAQLVPHRLCGSLGRPLFGRRGQGAQGPGAGSPAPGREEVAVAGEAGRRRLRRRRAVRTGGR